VVFYRCSEKTGLPFLPPFKPVFCPNFAARGLNLLLSTPPYFCLFFFLRGNFSFTIVVLVLFSFRTLFFARGYCCSARARSLKKGCSDLSSCLVKVSPSFRFSSCHFVLGCFVFVSEISTPLHIPNGAGEK